MENKSKTDDQNKSIGIWIKILIPVLIVIVIAGIFVYKNQLLQDTNDNSTDSEPTVQISTMEQEAEQSVTQAIDITDNTETDFNSVEFDLDATEDFNLEKILSYGLPVIIDFGSDSCIPCQEMAPTLEELNKEFRGKVIVKFVDVWVISDAAQVVPLRVIPTQFFFNEDGTPYVPSDAQSSSFIMYGDQETKVHLFTAHEGGMTKEEILNVLEELGAE